MYQLRHGMTLERLMFKACLLLLAKMLNAEQCKIISILTMGSENFRAEGLRLVSRVMMIIIESKDYQESKDVLSAKLRHISHHSSFHMDFPIHSLPSSPHRKEDCRSGNSKTIFRRAEQMKAK